MLSRVNEIRENIGATPIVKKIAESRLGVV